MRLTKACEHVEAAHDGHLHIEQHEIAGLGRNDLQCELPVGGHTHVVALRSETTRHHVANGIAVVDHQEPACSTHRIGPMARSFSIFCNSCGNRTGLVSKSSPPAASA